MKINFSRAQTTSSSEFLGLDASDFNAPGGGRGVLIYFSVWGRAAEQGVIFRIPTPGQGIIFLKICSMTGSIFVTFDSEKSF